MIIFYFFLCLAAVVAAVWLVNLIEHDPGYLLLSYSNWTIETSVWVALITILLGILLLYLLWILLRFFLRRSHAFGRWFTHRGERKAQEQTTRGMVAFNEGNWERAGRLLSRSAEKSGTPLINYLYAAKAANRAGEVEAAENFLNEVSKHGGLAVTAVDLTQAEMQLEQGRLEDSLATLSRLKQQHGHNPRVIELQRDVFLALNDWQSLQSLLPEIDKAGLMSAKDFSALQQLTATKLLLHAVNGRSANKRDAVATAWKQIDGEVKKQPDVLSCYIDCLEKTRELDVAEKVVRQHLNDQWNQQLVDVYGEIPALDAKKQLIHVEHWLQERNSDATLLLCAGRVARRAGEQQKAKEYLESSLKLQPRDITYAELAHLYAEMKDFEQSTELFAKSYQNSKVGQLPPVRNPS